MPVGDLPVPSTALCLAPGAPWVSRDGGQSACGHPVGTGGVTMSDPSWPLAG